jgi:hypothetical protein
MNFNKDNIEEEIAETKSKIFIDLTLKPLVDKAYGPANDTGNLVKKKLHYKDGKYIIDYGNKRIFYFTCAVSKSSRDKLFGLSELFSYIDVFEADKFVIMIPTKRHINQYDKLHLPKILKVNSVQINASYLDILDLLKNVLFEFKKTDYMDPEIVVSDYDIIPPKNLIKCTGRKPTICLSFYRKLNDEEIDIVKSYLDDDFNFSIELINSKNLTINLEISNYQELKKFELRQENHFQK